MGDECCYWRMVATLSGLESRACPPVWWSPPTCIVTVLASQSTVQHLIDPSSPALSTRLRSHFPVSVPWKADGPSSSPRCMVLGQSLNPKMPLGCACNLSATGRKRSSSHGVLLLLGAAFVKAGSQKYKFQFNVPGFTTHSKAPGKRQSHKVYSTVLVLENTNCLRSIDFGRGPALWLYID